VIAGLAPDKGETVAQVFYRDEKHSRSPQLAPDADGFIWMPEGGLQKCLLALRDGRTNRIIGSCPEANRTEMHSRTGSTTGLEVQTFLVPHCRRGPHDQPQNTTLYGAANGSNNKVTRRRSHTIAECAAEGCGHHPGSEACGVLLSGMG